MKVKVVRYERLFNLGSYEHEKIGVEVELTENETVSEVISKAAAFVEGQNRKHNNQRWIKAKKQDLKDYQNSIQENPGFPSEDYVVNQIKQLKTEIEELESIQYPEM
jgi:uncharacterized coiled-coil DUF342 family protein